MESKMKYLSEENINSYFYLINLKNQDLILEFLDTYDIEAQLALAEKKIINISIHYGSKPFIVKANLFHYACLVGYQQILEKLIALNFNYSAPLKSEDGQLILSAYDILALKTIK